MYFIKFTHDGFHIEINTFWLKSYYIYMKEGEGTCKDEDVSVIMLVENKNTPFYNIEHSI